MISLSQAIDSAQQFVSSYFSTDEIKSLRLEEVELSDDGKSWKITLGWVEPAVRTTSVGGLMGQGRADIVPLPRVYKQFLVNTETAEVTAMKFRDP
jgi:hypothetical protein